jgi:hypothetical protein
VSEEPGGSEHEQRGGDPDETGRWPETDAMGLDKRRSVVGGQYGATVRKQVTIYAIFFAVLIIVLIAFLTVVSNVDNRDIALEDTAPWTQAQSQSEPRPTDFPANGPTNTIPVDEIGKSVPPEQSDAQTGN